jgi:hypothetical protein
VKLFWLTVAVLALFVLAAIFVLNEVAMAL